VSTNLPTPTALLACPYGLDQIRATFGDIFQYVLPDHTLDLRWQTDFLVRIALPFALPLSWDKSRTVTQMTSTNQWLACSRMCSDIFKPPSCKKKSPASTDASRSVHSTPVPNCRRTRGESQIDLNPETNAQGTAGNMHPAVVGAFRDAGFKWAGDWQGRARDPMHFQFCTGC